MNTTCPNCGSGEDESHFNCWMSDEERSLLQATATRTELSPGEVLRRSLLYAADALVGDDEAESTRVTPPGGKS